MDRNMMTKISGKLYDLAVRPDLTPDAVMHMLEENARPRTLWQTLERYCTENAEMETQIRDGLFSHLTCRLSYENVVPDDNQKEKIRSRVSKWKSGKTQTIDKQTAIELCFIFGLSYEKANALVTMLSEEGFHCRDYNEIILIYALQRKLSYNEAYALEQKFRLRMGKESNPKQPAECQMTEFLQKDLSQVADEAGLEKFLDTNRNAMGSFHNRAYAFFSEALEELKKPYHEDEVLEALLDSDLKEPRYFVRTILRDRLLADDVKSARRRSRSAAYDYTMTRLEKVISDNWPGDSEISEMQSRKMDVTRKVMILLFMAHLKDPFEIQSGEDPWNEEDWDDDAEEDYDYFHHYYEGLNTMLESCGFSDLDPRSPFDWVIIYILNAGDTFDVDYRFQEVFRMMFGTKDQYSENMKASAPSAGSSRTEDKIRRSRL